MNLTIRKFVLEPSAVQRIVVRMPAVPLLARPDAQGRPCVFFTQNDDAAEAVSLSIVVQDTGQPFPAEVAGRLQYMGTFTSLLKAEGAPDLSVERHVFADMAGAVRVVNGSRIKL